MEVQAEDFYSQSKKAHLRSNVLPFRVSPPLTAAATLSTVPSTLTDYDSTPNPRTTPNKDPPQYQQAPTTTTISIQPSTSFSTDKAIGCFTFSKSFAAVTALLVTSCGGCAFFLTQWLNIPALNRQIQDLEAQVSHMAEENAEYARLNDELSNTTYTLNQTAEELQRQVHLLSVENDQFAGLNAKLEESNHQFNQTMGLLHMEVRNLTAENDRFARLNSDLTRIVLFLNSTATGVDESYELMIEHLGAQIEWNQLLIVESLHNLYLQRISNWDCSFLDYFEGEDFVQNQSLPIKSDAFPLVMDFVDTRVLQELCLDPSDFEEYLTSNATNESVVNGVSAAQLVSGVQRYTLAAMTYYFPADEQQQILEPSGVADGEVKEDTYREGLSVDDWVNASFACEGLPPDLLFRSSLFP